ncbi:MAG: hypothetical protein AAGA93_18200 [Actinomycetota bacterium]
MADVPTGWVEAERLAPTPVDGRPVWRGRSGLAAVPVRREGGFVANAVAAASGFVAGVAWYTADRIELYGGPFAPVAVALVVAIAVRLFSHAHPTHKSIVTVMTYLVVVLAVLLALTHGDLVSVYGRIDDYRAYEQSLIRSRLEEPIHLLGYGLGGLLALIVPAAGERR